MSDIDGDVPPLGVSDDDILSDCSLPLPSPPAYIRSPMSGMQFDGGPISPAARKFLYGDRLGLEGISVLSPAMSAVSAFSPGIYHESTSGIYTGVI